MNFLGYLQNVLDVWQGLCPLALQNSQLFVGSMNCLTYTSLEHILYWIVILCITLESPTVFMPKIVFSHIQGVPYAYFWAYLPLVCNSSHVALFKCLSVSSTNWSYKTLFESSPSLFHIPKNASRLTAELIVWLSSFVYFLSWSTIPRCPMSENRWITLIVQFF